MRKRIRDRDKISEIQELEFELIKKTNYNNFDGEYAVKVLMQHKKLWKGVVMDREIFISGDKVDSKYGKLTSDLIKLRDIDSDFWNVDTLFILSSEEDDEKLLLMANKLHPDELEWLDQKDASDRLGAFPAGRVLKLWWD